MLETWCLCPSLCVNGQRCDALNCTVRDRGAPVTAGPARLEANDMRTSVPKYIGFEIELGNHLDNAAGDQTAADAATALVAAHHRRFGGQTDGNSESAKEFDRDGFRFYLDHEHAEICSPLVPSATRLVLALRDARSMVAACKKAAEVEVGSLRVSYNNTSRHGVAWGFHVNVLVSRPAFDKWREDDWRPLQPQWLPFLATSLPIVGTGKVGAENGARNAAFQFSQRADFMDAEIGLETVDSKTLINTRDEPLADPDRYARLHIIAWDTNLMDFANWLKFGISQILLALIEEGVPMPDLTLDDPVQAIQAVSRDLKLQKRLKLQDGCRETALGVQRRLAEAAARAIEAGCAACQVPDAELIVECWLEALDDLEARRSDRLSRRLDWCAKFNLLQRAQELGKTDQQQMVLDLHYAEVGGLFEKLEQTGAVDRLEDFVPRKNLTIRKTQLVPREQARAVLIRKFGSHLAGVGWDHAAGRDETGRLWFIPMVDPLGGRDLLRVVSSAEDWASCLGRLIQMDMAQAIAVCAVVCESSENGSEQIAEEFSVR